MTHTSSKAASTLAIAAFIGATAATSTFAVTAPDLPMAGWATQNGGTTGGAGKTVVTVSNVSDLRKYAEAGNYTIYVKPGTYKVPSKSAISVGNNVTIYGYQGAVLEQTLTNNTNEDNTVMTIKGKNVILRNLTFKGAGSIDKDAGDCLHVDGGSNVWLDHLDVYDGEDGNLDVINGANYVTISWTKFSYTSASTEHQFSNLIGNSDSKTSDRGKLKTTLHHNWWANGVKERMPRVRYGQVHVANNLFNSNTSSTCVRAAIEADLRVENNVFIGVNKPIDYYDGKHTAVASTGNFLENIKKGDANADKASSAFKPSYSMGLTDVSTQGKAYALRDSITQYAGATLPNPGEGTSVTPVSSSSVAASSSSAKSSSSTGNLTSSSSGTSSSSVMGGGEASLTKHGSGSANQSVAQGQAIAEFYYTVTGATGASVTGLPDGVTGTMQGSDFHIAGTVSASAAAGDYKFTVTTTGGSSNATKSGTITVTPANGSTAASSSSVAKSSSSEGKSSSSVTVDESSSSLGTTSLAGIASGTHFQVETVGRSIRIAGAVGKTVALFDMQGRLFATEAVTQENFEMNLSRSGSYILRIGKSTTRIQVK